jgi:hypothetical protein
MPSVAQLDEHVLTVGAIKATVFLVFLGFVWATLARRKTGLADVFSLFL